jgi:hypothetical protein
MALDARAINPACLPPSAELIDKHFLRKHGANAYYGQPMTRSPLLVDVNATEGKMPS